MDHAKQPEHFSRFIIDHANCELNA
ncbi:MAG: hypothetical protein ACFHVJ_16065 [Aestuariibacter sp.]